jgi:hypothetical protein
MFMSVKLSACTLGVRQWLSGHRAGARGAGIAATLLAAVTFAASPMAAAQVNVTTQHNDIGRTGQNLNETTLTPANVSSGQFGLLFALPVVGPVYAQPLYLSGITVNGATHNVVYVATLSGNVYAFDANSNTGANTGPLWSISLLDTAHGAAPGASLYASLGTTSTPVIDTTASPPTLYVTSTSYESGAPVFRLHALDATTGAEKFNGPVAITPSAPGTAADAVGGTVSLTTRNHNLRPGLLLLNGIVYVGLASYPEGEESTWHGWIVGYDSTTLAQTGVFLSTPNGNGGGIWMSGNGLAGDQLDPVNYPFGRMFVASGNGDFTATAPYITNNMDFGDSILDLDLTNGVPTVTDDFTPDTQAHLAATDGDQGSGGVLVLPTQTGSYPNLLVQGGKSGTLYLADRDALGGYSPTSNQVVQSLPLEIGNVGAWSAPAYWNGNVYYWGVYDYLKSFPLVNGALSTPPTESQEVSGFFGTTPSISANGNTAGIVWNIDADAAAIAGGGPAILEAHNASNVATTLYSSATNPARDTAGPAVHFTVPTVANGMVYVGTASQLDVYGLISASQTGTPMFSPGSETFAGTLSVSITDATAGAAIYYTTDGSTPTYPISGTTQLYTGPLTVSGGEIINAIALAPGATQSNQGWASYINVHTATPAFQTPGLAYPGPQSLVITDATPGAVIYYTTNGSKPTLSSTVYSGPITVNQSETIAAVALAPGYSISTVTSAAYTIATSSSTIAISDQSGFSSSAGLNLLGAATVSNNALQLTAAGAPGGPTFASAVWYTTPLNIQSFTTDFYIQETLPFADGFTFAIQNSPAGVDALGGASGGLGYQGLASSVAVKFDLFDNAGEGTDSTGFYTNGASPTMPALDMTTSSLNLHGPDMLHAHITYDGTTLTLLLTDTVSGASYTASTPINIPNVVGAPSAYVGFTASAHGAGATQTILNWTYLQSSGAPLGTPTPTFTPEPGAYAGPQSVAIGDALAGAAIYFTTDGSAPTYPISGTTQKYTGPITIAVNETLSAIAVANGNNSAVGSGAYQIAAAVPTFTPPAGTYSSAQSVTINDATPGATIYYTTNGTVPNTSSTVYSAPVSVTANEKLEAIAVSGTNTASAVGAATYNIHTPTPTFTPAAGTYSSAQSVTIGDANAGAAIYYTTDGSTPTYPISGTTQQYTGPIGVSADETVKAIGLASGYISSFVATGNYKISAPAPTFSPAAGTYSSPQAVTISDADAGATIYYTTNGATPTTASTVYSSPITVSTDQTLKAIAGGGGFATGPVASATYSIRLPSPTFAPAAGTYSSAQSVTIGDANAGAGIYYTTDDSTPTYPVSGTTQQYTGPIDVSADETIKAIAAASDNFSSFVAAAKYSISAPAPTFSLAAGTYSGPQSVTISDADAGATIYYTTNGATPTTHSTVYSSPITVSSDETLEAIAAGGGFAAGPVASVTYSIRLSAPTFAPVAGTYSSAQSVTIGDADAGAGIYYTTDGSKPTYPVSGTTQQYMGPISVNADETLKAIAAAAGYSSSFVGAATYKIK